MVAAALLVLPLLLVLVVVGLLTSGVALAQDAAQVLVLQVEELLSGGFRGAALLSGGHREKEGPAAGEVAGVLPSSRPSCLGGAELLRRVQVAVVLSGGPRGLDGHSPRAAVVAANGVVRWVVSASSKLRTFEQKILCII